MYERFNTYYRPGNVAETIVIFAVLFPQNLNDGSDDSFTQHFPSNINVD